MLVVLDPALIFFLTPLFQGSATKSFYGRTGEGEEDSHVSDAESTTCHSI